jgi:hypothetical protein
VRHIPVLSAYRQKGHDLVPAAEERLHDTGIEVSAGILGHVSPGTLRCPSLLVGALGRESVEDVRHRNDPA